MGSTSSPQFSQRTSTESILAPRIVSGIAVEKVTEEKPRTGDWVLGTGACGCPLLLIGSSMRQPFARCAGFPELRTLRIIPRIIKPAQTVRLVTGSGIVAATLDLSATEKVSLPPATFISRALKPIRLVALRIFAIPLQPDTAAFVQMKGLIAAACTEFRTNANPRFPWP